MNKKGGIIFKISYTIIVLIVGLVLGVIFFTKVSNFVVPLFSSSPSLSPPSNYISDNDIQVYNDKIILLVANASVTNYGSTGSMLPTLNENSNGIAIVPENENEIRVGDIVSYRSLDGNLIVHRIIEKSLDDDGIYFVVKGDNSAVTEVIRFSQIERKLVGILY